MSASSSKESVIALNFSQLIPTSEALSEDFGGNLCCDLPQKVRFSRISSELASVNDAVWAPLHAGTSHRFDAESPFFVHLSGSALPPPASWFGARLAFLVSLSNPSLTSPPQVAAPPSCCFPRALRMKDFHGPI